MTDAPREGRRAWSRRMPYGVAKMAVGGLLSKELCRVRLVGGCSTEISGRGVGFVSTLGSEGRTGVGGGSWSVSGSVVTVFGATGFLGRYVVQKLAKSGSQVIVPHRGLEGACKHLKLLGGVGQIVTAKFDVRNENSIKAVLAPSNAVVNLIGRDYESHNFSFEELNVGIPERISRLARVHGRINRYVQVSALGASLQHRAPQYRTKASGEEITMKNFPKATILRPAHLVGPEDRLLNMWASFARDMPTVPIIGDGSTRFQPAHVTDVAAAIVLAVKDDGSSVGKTFELGGPDVYTMNEIVSLVYDVIKEEPRTFYIPFSVAKLISTPEDIFKSIPSPTLKVIMFSSSNIKSLRAHYTVSPDALAFRDMGIQAQKLEGVALAYLHRYRTGGSYVGKLKPKVAS